MQTTAGIFNTAGDARRAVQELRSAGFDDHHITLLYPGSSEDQVQSVPTHEAEQPGMGGAIGGVAGGAVGLAAGPLIASLFLPGVGPITAIGFAAAAGGGLGVLAGSLTGSALEKSATTGLPKDELFFYEDALRKGKSVVIALAEDDAQLEKAKEVLARHGADSVDAARDAWWIGLRSAEETQYTGPGKDFASAEAIYRKGFQAALDYPARGKSYREAADYLRNVYPEVYEHDDFIAGFERGRAYYERLCREHGAGEHEKEKPLRRSG